MSQAGADHPLSRSWRFWIDECGQKNASRQTFEATLSKCSACTSIESFWRAYAQLPSIELLQNRKVSVHFMEDPIKPLWEDEHNINGGMATVKCDKDCTACVWKELLIDLISTPETKQSENKLNGLSVTTKKNTNIISFWFNTTDASFWKKAIHTCTVRYPEIKETDVCWTENMEHIKHNNRQV